MKFLIVDDDLDMARYILIVLKNEGIDSDIAGSAEVARNLFIRDDFDALVVDAILPGESGISLVNGLRELNRNIPVLFCTGATDEFNKNLLGSLGTLCHKPLDASFPSIIREFVGSFATSV